jgi:hypothetical protein
MQSQSEVGISDSNFAYAVIDNRKCPRAAGTAGGVAQED